MKVQRNFLLLAVLCVSACATMKPGFETPTVRVMSFRPLPSQGLAPRFEIGLRVINPNADALKLRGMSYNVSLDNYRVVEGAASDLPVVPAYGEATIKLTAAVSLVDAMRFVNGLMSDTDGQVEYRLQAKLDVGALMPAIRIEEKGLLGTRDGQTL
jgi:LEA14-like dessication related protein